MERCQRSGVPRKCHQVDVCGLGTTWNLTQCPVWPKRQDPACLGSVGGAVARPSSASRRARRKDGAIPPGEVWPAGDRPRSALLQPDDDQHDQHYEAPGHRHIKNGHESPCCLGHATCAGHCDALQPGAQIMAAVFRHVLLIGPALRRFRVLVAWREWCIVRSILIRSATCPIHATSAFRSRRSR